MLIGSRTNHIALVRYAPHSVKIDDENYTHDVK